MSEEQDRTLATPKPILPPLKVSRRAGEVPTDDDRLVLKVPIGGL